MKICAKCKENKPLNEFSVRKASKDGLYYRCKDCFNKRQNKYNRNRPTRTFTPEQRKIKRANALRFSYTLKGKLGSYKGKAKARNIPWGLTKDEFMSLWQEPCSYCGNNIETIGIDRVDSSVGYIVSNVVSCCTWCNTMKLNSSYDEFIEQCGNIHYYNKLGRLKIA